MTQTHPGITARLMLEEEEFEQDEMFDLLAVSDSYGERFIYGKAPMTDQIARALENQGFGTWQYWIKAQVKYDRGSP